MCVGYDGNDDSLGADKFSFLFVHSYQVIWFGVTCRWHGLRFFLKSVFVIAIALLSDPGVRLSLFLFPLYFMLGVMWFHLFHPERMFKKPSQAKLTGEDGRCDWRGLSLPLPFSLLIMQWRPFTLWRHKTLNDGIPRNIGANIFCCQQIVWHAISSQSETYLLTYIAGRPDCCILLC